MGILLNMIIVVLSYLWFGSLIGLIHYSLIRKNYDAINPWIESKGMTWNQAFGIKFYLWLIFNWYHMFLVNVV